MSLTSTREFMLNEKMISLTDKGEIKTKDGVLLGTFRGKFIKIGNTYRIRDLDDVPILTIQEKIISLRSTYKFYKGGEKEEDKFIGKLKQKIVAFPAKYWFEDPNENKVFKMKGNIMTIKFKILKDGQEVAEIRKKLWKSLLKNTFGIKMSPDLDDDSAMLILGIVIMLHHEKEENRKRH
ncbi:MAG: LURP-one-related family protein [Candidatus Lokiarchaeota archaeon]|nr:LURP-one-related family protein [Candidatus Lokiarchaeota archaeon]